MLSEKSLEMCTESLGSETGSDGGESSDEMALLSLSNVNHESLREKSKFRETKRMMSRSTSFPPPLTSISGSTTVQVRPHREGGRLVLKAVSVSSCQAYFRAERIDGRLKLHLVKDCSPSHDPEEEKEEEEESLQEPSVDEESEGEEDNWEEEYSEENSGNGGAEMGWRSCLRQAGVGDEFLQPIRHPSSTVIMRTRLVILQVTWHPSKGLLTDPWGLRVADHRALSLVDATMLMQDVLPRVLPYVLSDAHSSS
ncbi:hypothetical protein GH714_024907 [Hevea brasiliensis]|uniref:FAF domain-containing protein n=1 Tax=Hevea brasiliensis TaxID=3981 RepID=A0A6A6NIU4_HEVBR|nr:hypothetical protein GH714_024907 [Hevea brasiliensis]